MEENTNSQPQVTAEESRMKKHVSVAAILQIVFGALNILAALGVGIAFGFVEKYAEDPTATQILGIIGTPLIVMLILIGGAMIAGGIGLFSCKQWARMLTLVMAALGLLNIPIGTLKGVYIIWVLVQSETVSLFAKGCPPAPVTQ